MNPCSKAGGVDGTLTISRRAPSVTTQSVNVPPMSMQMSYRATVSPRPLPAAWWQPTDAPRKGFADEIGCTAPTEADAPEREGAVSFSRPARTPFEESNLPFRVDLFAGDFYPRTVPNCAPDGHPATG